MFFKTDGINYIIEYGFGLILINIVIYLFLLTSFFSIVLYFNQYDNLKIISNLKKIIKLRFIKFLIILNFLSLAGVPPLIGFVGKFIALIFIILKGQYFLFIIFCIVNIFMLFFYVQNIRYLVAEKYSLIDLVNYNNFSINISINYIFILIILNFFNLFSFLNFQNFFLFFLNMSYYLYI